MKYTSIPADKSNYYAGRKRKYSDVKFIVIHYTGNNNDKAVSNGRYFAAPNRKASAHFFIGQDGTIVKSVNLPRIAWSVGGSKYANCKDTGGGKYYGICTNNNSVSIELCDNKILDPSEEQIRAIVECVEYIRKKCKNANYIIRHFDVTGKPCPARMTDETAEKRERWLKFKARIYADAGMATK